MLSGRSTPAKRPQTVTPSNRRRILHLPHRGLLGPAALCMVTTFLGCGGKVVVDGHSGSGGSTGTGGHGGSSSTFSTTAITSGNTTSSSGTGGEGGAPPIPPLVLQDLGEHPIGVPVGFDIPQGSLGFTAVAELTDPAASNDLIGIKAILPPVGLPVVSDYTMATALTLAQFVGWGIAAAAVPQSDASTAMPLMPGEWRLVLDDDGQGAASAHVTIWIRQTVDGLYHGGKLDVNVLIAEGASTMEYMETAIHTAFQGYIGLSLGTISYTNIGPEWAYIDEVTMYQALEQTKGLPGKPALNVIVVSYLGGGLEGAAGVTAAAPAYALKHGTHISGLFMIPSEDELDTVVLQHEMGHFAGLLHTSEFMAGFGDALGDTLFCDDVTGQFESCPDYSNLMFPTGGDFTKALTPQQMLVMQASAVYRGIVEEGGGSAKPLPIVADTGGEPTGASRGTPAAEPSAKSAPGGGIPALTEAPWSAGLPKRAAQLLAGHWCASGGGPKPDFYGLLRNLGATDPDALLSVGLDPEAPMHVRKRALAAAGRGSPARKALLELARIAEDASMPRAARIGAIEGLAATKGPVSKTLAGRLKTDTDGVIARIAARALR